MNVNSTDNYEGIMVYTSDFANITDAVVYSSNYRGVYIWGSENCSVKDLIAINPSFIHKCKGLVRLNPPKENER